MKRLINIGILSLTLVACGQRYKMQNMVPETIDVTRYIKSGQFLPDSCGGRLDRLIKVKPLVLDESYETQLQDKLQNWKTEYNKWMKENNRNVVDFKVTDLFRKTTYQYSYFITTDPIDVYRSDIDKEINGQQGFILFIRLDQNGKIFSDYKEEGWVINSCDTINSTIQNIR